MKKMILAATILMSSLANAQATKVLECGFTEPFFTLNINLETREIQRIDPDWNNGGGGTVTTTIATNINLKPDFSDPLLPQYKVIGQDGALIANITMDMQGSDGMSDITFPFTIIFDGMYGGCSSDKIKELNPKF